MNQPCKNRVVCPGPTPGFDADDPVTNFSSEQVDGVNFSEMSWPIIDFTNPFTPDDPNNPPDTCDNPISQDEAELCVINKNFDNQAARNGSSRVLFTSGAQTCGINCPDGSAFFWTVPAGAFTDFSQAAADQRAKAYACKQVGRNAVCINVQSTSCCLGANFLSVVTVDGGFTPYAIKMVAGALPPGVGFVQDTNTTAFFSGIPTAPGIYSVALAAQDSHGNIMTRTVTFTVLAISNATAIPLPAQGSFYNFQLQAIGGTAPYTFSDGFGLPAGLVLQSDGFIVGNPVDPIGTGFIAVVTDARGNSCSFELTYLSGCVLFNHIVWDDPIDTNQKPVLHVPPNFGSGTLTYPAANSVLISGNCFINPLNPDFQTALGNTGLVLTNGYTGDCKLTVTAVMSGDWIFEVYVTDPTFLITYFDTTVLNKNGNFSNTYTFAIPNIPQIAVGVTMIYGLNNITANASGTFRVDFGA